MRLRVSAGVGRFWGRIWTSDVLVAIGHRAGWRVSQESHLGAFYGYGRQAWFDTEMFRQWRMLSKESSRGRHGVGFGTRGIDIPRGPGPPTFFERWIISSLEAERGHLRQKGRGTVKVLGEPSGVEGKVTGMGHRGVWSLKPTVIGRGVLAVGDSDNLSGSCFSRLRPRSEEAGKDSWCPLVSHVGDRAGPSRARHELQAQ